MKHNFSASNIPTILSKAYQNTTKVYQFDKMAFHLFLKSFLLPPCLNSRVFIVSVSPTLPQTCCQGAKGPLGSSASACSWTCLIPTHSPSHLQPSSFPPWWGLWDSTLPQGHSPHHRLSLTSSPFPSEQPLSLHLDAFVHDSHVWIQSRGMFLEISIFCLSDHYYPLKIPENCNAISELSEILPNISVLVFWLKTFLLCPRARGAGQRLCLQ